MSSLLTPYGEKKYYRSEDLVTFEKRKMGDKEIEVTSIPKILKRILRTICKKLVLDA